MSVFRRRKYEDTIEQIHGVYTCNAQKQVNVYRYHRQTLHWSLFLVGFGFDLMHFEASLILVLTLLRPKDLLQYNGPDHHIKHKKVHQNKEYYHGTPDDQDGFARKSFANSKGRSDQRRVGKNKREPCHGKDQSTGSNDGPVGTTGDEEEEYRQSKPSVNVFKEGVACLPPQPQGREINHDF